MKLVNKKNQLTCSAFSIAGNDYLFVGAYYGNSIKPADAMDTILNLNNGNRKYLKRGNINEYFNNFKVIILDWDAFKITEEYNKYLLRSKNL